MKKLSPSHSWSFTQQANIHCVNCADTYAQPSHPTLPIHVHASWLFHLCYLYFYERILRKLIGDDSFVLPFWNWDSPDGMIIPPAFADPSLTLYNSLRNKLLQPPNITDLDSNGTEAMLTFDGYIAHNYWVMYCNIVSGARTAKLFYGSPYWPGTGLSSAQAPWRAARTMRSTCGSTVTSLVSWLTREWGSGVGGL